MTIDGTTFILSDAVRKCFEAEVVLKGQQSLHITKGHSEIIMEITSGAQAAKAFI